MSGFIVVGAGIAGASAGYHLARHGTVTLLEMEPAPGYHSTGRSAALFSEYYGNPVVRVLTAASRPFFDAPPHGFTAHPLLSPRGVVALCPAGAEERFDAALRDGLRAPSPVREIDLAEVRLRCPIVRPGWFTRAMVKPAAADIDVDALHQGFLRGIRAAGGSVVTRARVCSLTRSGGGWQVGTDQGVYEATTVINAAGAWADEIADLAGAGRIGLVPRRRTVFLVDGPAGVDIAGWPMVADVTETFYFKPESGRLLISPVDATAVSPGDARPDDLDVALGVARFEDVTDLPVRTVRRSWAGLRSSVPDDTPVIGADPDLPGFHWFAGLGGYGVQIAPAAGELLASTVLSAGPVAGSTVEPGAVAPARLTRRPGRLVS